MEPNGQKALQQCREGNSETYSLAYPLTGPQRLFYFPCLEEEMVREMSGSFKNTLLIVPSGQEYCGWGSLKMGPWYLWGWKNLRMMWSRAQLEAKQFWFSDSFISVVGTQWRVLHLAITSCDQTVMCPRDCDHLRVCITQLRLGHGAVTNSSCNVTYLR